MFLAYLDHLESSICPTWCRLFRRWLLILDFAVIPRKKVVRCEISSRASSGCDGTTTLRGANDYGSNRSDELSDLPYSICGDVTSCLTMLVYRDTHLMWGLFNVCGCSADAFFSCDYFLNAVPSEQRFLLSYAATSFSDPCTEISLSFFSTALKVSRVDRFVPALPTRVISFSDVCSSGLQHDTATQGWIVG